MSGSVIVAGARTPIGRLLGGLKDQSAADLGGVAIKGALEKAGVSGEQVDYVIMGQVIQAGAGQNPARMAAVNGGIPMSVPSITINKVCLSGLNAIYLADQMIQAGDADIVVAGGMESMTNAPYLIPKARGGYRIVSGGTDNHLMLVDVFSKGLTGKVAEAALGKAGITVNKNAIPFDQNPPMTASGIRIGTPAVTTRGMGEREMDTVGELGAVHVRETLGERLDLTLQSDLRVDESAGGGRFGHRTPHRSSQGQ